LISEELAGEGSSGPSSNSDPVTGQAAWYDVRVRIYAAGDDEPQQSWPQTKTVKLAPGMKPAPKKRGWMAGVMGKKTP
jgi:hypothetical protein